MQERGDGPVVRSEPAEAGEPVARQHQRRLDIESCRPVERPIGLLPIWELQGLGREANEVERVQEREEAERGAETAVLRRWDDADQDHHGAQGEGCPVEVGQGVPGNAASQEPAPAERGRTHRGRPAATRSSTVRLSTASSSRKPGSARITSRV